MRRLRIKTERSKVWGKTVSKSWIARLMWGTSVTDEECLLSVPSSYNTPEEAAQALAVELEALEHSMARNFYIACADGTLLHVCKGGLFSDWGYNIVRQGSHASCWGDKSFNDAVTSARNHAIAYGGMVWEVSR